MAVLQLVTGAWSAVVWRVLSAARPLPASCMLDLWAWGANTRPQNRVRFTLDLVWPFLGLPT